MDTKLNSSAGNEDCEVLTVDAMVRGIGRKATNQELQNYFLSNIDAEPVALDVAFAKYESTN